MLGTTKFITLKAAQTMMAAAEAEATRNGWKVAIAIVDVSGNLIMFQKADGTQTGSVNIAQAKARTAAQFMRPTKALEDVVAGGRVAFLAAEGVLPLQGGVPVLADGVCVGAVGVSGVMSNQDEQVATVAVAALGL